MCKRNMGIEKIHILLIGPVTNIKSNLIGGATISFGYLVDYLTRNGNEFTVVNTKVFPSGLSQIFNPLIVLFLVMLNLFKTDVLFLNSSRGGTKYLAPFLYFLAKAFSKKFVFRPFGGNINEYTSKYNKVQNWIFESSIIKADIFFLQTKELIEYYSKYDAKTIQLPTSRDNPASHLLRGNRVFQKRFVYIGFINEAKGINHILEAASRLGDDYTIDMFGPIKQEKFLGQLEVNKHYKGVLKKEQVLETLKTYDVLVLPTYYEGEGYPGVIIEAYSLGLPVISTDWKAIPEIISHNKTGQIIKPKSTDALIAAIQSFDETNYEMFSQNARAYFLKKFETEKVCGQVVAKINSLFKNQNTTLTK